MDDENQLTILNGFHISLAFIIAFTEYSLHSQFFRQPAFILRIRVYINTNSKENLDTISTQKKIHRAMKKS